MYILFDYTYPNLHTRVSTSEDGLTHFTADIVMEDGHQQHMLGDETLRNERPRHTRIKDNLCQCLAQLRPTVAPEQRLYLTADWLQVGLAQSTCKHNKPFDI